MNVFVHLALATYRCCTIHLNTLSQMLAKYEERVYCEYIGDTFSGKCNDILLL